MTFTTQDMKKLQALMAESPENRELLEKLLNHHQYSIGQISHELRNPLALVYSTLQLIESSHPEVADIKHWYYMKEDIEYMKILLENLSSFNNSERLQLTEINIRSLMEHLVISFAASLTDTSIEFTSKINPSLPQITGDKIKLQELFLNLLHNAKDAVGDCGAITLHAYQEKKNIIIKISDTGCGIAEEDLSNIFHPFVTHKQGGSGLGLAIVQRVVHGHLGTIRAESTVNAGTDFIVSLPVYKDTQ